MDHYTESSGVDTSPDLNSSSEITHSPERIITVQPRKLTFGPSPEVPRNNHVREELMAATLATSPKKNPSISPPYRRVRALRLFDTPATPKTIIQKSGGKCNPLKSGLLDLKDDCDNFRILARPNNISTPMPEERPKALHLHNKVLESTMPMANVNPFTPDSLQMKNKKRSRTQLGRENYHNHSFPLSLLNNNNNLNHQKNCSHPDLLSKFSDEEDMHEIRQAPKRLALQDSNISRYQQEFVELSLIGVGEFGLVYKCLNRLDGCVYAIKKSIRPVAGSVFEKTALNEVWAHAVLGKHVNVVRYYSAWAENNHMLIQNEYCNGGSLQTVITKRSLVEAELLTLLAHIGEGLKYIHQSDLVHMDLKAGNIFLTKEPARPATTSVTDSCDDGFEDSCDDVDHNDYIITYKIGDLGHVTSVYDPQVEEGDCRYLPNEILQENYSHLQKADIFSLGITLFEAASGVPLPKNGPEWHKLRNGEVPFLPHLSKEFNDLIRLMTHPDPEKRPSSTSLFNHAILNPAETKTKAQLCLELATERRKNEVLMKKLKETKKILKSYEYSKTPVNKKMKMEPLISDRKLRSGTRKSSRTALTTNRKNIQQNRKMFMDDDY